MNPLPPLNACIAVVGLGRVGLPLGVEFGKDARTIGFDIGETKVAECRAGTDSSREIHNADMTLAVHAEFTSDPAMLRAADFSLSRAHPRRRSPYIRFPTAHWTEGSPGVSAVERLRPGQMELLAGRDCRQRLSRIRVVLARLVRPVIVAHRLDGFACITASAGRGPRGATALFCEQARGPLPNALPC